MYKIVLLRSSVVVPVARADMADHLDLPEVVVGQAARSATIAPTWTCSSTRQRTSTVACPLSSRVSPKPVSSSAACSADKGLSSANSRSNSSRSSPATSGRAHLPPEAMEASELPEHPAELPALLVVEDNLQLKRGGPLQQAKPS